MSIRIPKFGPGGFCPNATHIARLAWTDTGVDHGQVVRDERGGPCWFVEGRRLTSWTGSQGGGDEVLLYLKQVTPPEPLGEASLVELEELEPIDAPPTAPGGWALLVIAGRMDRDDVHRVLAWAQQHPANFAKLDRAGLEAVLGKPVDPDLRFEMRSAEYGYQVRQRGGEPPTP